MAEKRRRMTKHEMREDEFVIRVFQVLDWIRHNTAAVAGVAGVVVLAVLIFAFAVRTRRDAAVHASRTLLEARSALLTGNLDDAIRLYRTVMDEDSGSEEGRAATFLAASVSYQQGQLDAARELFQTYLKHDGGPAARRVSAHEGLAAVAEGSGDPSTAAQAYQDAADCAESQGEPGRAADDLWQAARCFQAAGDLQQGRQVLIRLVHDHPDWTRRPDAESLAAELGYQMGLEGEALATSEESTFGA